MFCNKCGSKLPDGAAFCHVCGSKTVQTKKSEQETAPAKSFSTQVTQQSQPTISGSLPTQPTYAIQQKKSKAPWIIIIGLVVIATIAFFVYIATQNKTGNQSGSTNNSFGGNSTVGNSTGGNSIGGISYTETAKQYSPFTASSSLNYTIGEVVDAYISSPSWKNYESGGEMYVEVTGALSGNNGNFSAKFTVEKHQYDNYCTINPISISVGSKQATSQNAISEVLFGMFFGYKQCRQGEGTNIHQYLVEAPASDFTYEYSKTWEGMVIKGYNGNAEAVVIPETINGEPVVYIERRAFANRKSLNYIALSSTVKGIDGYAFDECKNLVYLLIPSITKGPFLYPLLGHSATIVCHDNTPIQRHCEEYPSLLSYVLI